MFKDCFATTKKKSVISFNNVEIGIVILYMNLNLSYQFFVPTTSVHGFGPGAYSSMHWMGSRVNPGQVNDYHMVKRQSLNISTSTEGHMIENVKHIRWSRFIFIDLLANINI